MLSRSEALVCVVDYKTSPNFPSAWGRIWNVTSRVNLSFKWAPGRARWMRQLIGVPSLPTLPFTRGNLKISESSRRWVIEWPPSCPEAAADGLTGDPKYLFIIYTALKYPELKVKMMCCLHRRTCPSTVHAQFQTLFLPSNSKQQQEGDSHARRLWLPWRRLVWCSVPVLGGGLCEWTLCSGSLWLWHHHGRKSSTWASLHEPSHTAHSCRYATMTHAPFSNSMV